MGGIFGGSGSGGGSSTTVQKNELDPDIKARFLSNVDRATNVATGIGTQQFAPRTGDYIGGENLIRQSSMNGPGISTVDQATNTANRLQNTGPMFVNAPTTGAALTGSAGYNAANAGSTGYGAALANARGYDAANSNATGYNAQFGNAAQLNGNDVSNYMSPYIGNVVDSTLFDLNRSRRMAMNDNNSSATKARAFGGSRQAVQNALTNEAYDRNTASAVANLYNTGYQNALNSAQQDVTNRQNMIMANLGYGNRANEFGAQAFNTAALQNANAQNQARQFGALADNTASMQNAASVNQANQFGAQAFNTASLQNANAQNQAGQFNSGAQNTAMLANQNALNNMGQFNSNLNFQGQRANQDAFQNSLTQQLSAANLANTLGQTQQTLRANAGQNLMNLGLANQQFSQQQLDAIRNLPLEQQAIINQALGLNPAGGSGQTGQSNSSSNQSSSQGTGLFGLFR